MSEALNQTLGNAEQVQVSEVDTQSKEYLEARQAFFEGMDKPTVKEEPKSEEPTTSSEETEQEPPQDEPIQSQEKGEQDNGLQQEEVLNNQTKEIVEQEQQLEEQPSEDKSAKQKRQYKVKANGEEFNVSFDEMRLLASKGINYTQKMQKIAPHRKMISAITEAGITEDEINQFIEMRKGNKDAVGAFTKKYNIALSDIEEGEKAEGYKPQQYGREQTALNDIDEELSVSMNRQNYDRMVNFFNRELDANSVQFFVDNPEALRILSRDIESGNFDVIRKEVRLGEMTDKYKPGTSYIDKYRYEALQIEEAQKQQKQQPKQAVQQPSVDKTKLGASGVKNVADNTKKQINSLAEIDDDDYAAWKKRLMI